MSRRAAAAGRATRTRRTRAATETTIEPDQENHPELLRDMVVRDERGNYLHEVPALGEHTDGAEDEGMITSSIFNSASTNAQKNSKNNNV